MKTSSIFAKRLGLTGLAGTCAALLAAASPAFAQPHPQGVPARNMMRVAPSILSPCASLQSGFTPDRFGALPPDRMQVVAMYDGDGGAATLGIHLWNPVTGHCCVETLYNLTNSQIVTQEFGLNGFEPTGVFEINGVVPNGGIDGVAFGLYFRDNVLGDRHLLRSAGTGLGAGVPNFVGAWPVAWSQTDWDNKLTGITGTNYDAFVARRQAQITLSGAQLMPNGRHHVPTDRLTGDVDGSGGVDNNDILLIQANVGQGCGNLNCSGIGLLSGFTSDRFGALPTNRMQVVAMYDGDPSGNLKLTINLWNPTTNQCCELVVGGFTNSDILTLEYAMGGFVPTGVVQVNGVIPNGGVDGVAFGLYFRDAAGDRRVLRSAEPDYAIGSPNFVGGWPLAWAQADWDARLTALGGTSYDAFVVRRQAQVTLSGAQLLPNGIHNNYSNWSRPLTGDVFGDGCLNAPDFSLTYFNLGKGCP